MRKIEFSLFLITGVSLINGSLFIINQLATPVPSPGPSIWLVVNKYLLNKCIFNLQYNLEAAGYNCDKITIQYQIVPHVIAISFITDFSHLFSDLLCSLPPNSPQSHLKLNSAVLSPSIHTTPSSQPRGDAIYPSPAPCQDNAQGSLCFPIQFSQQLCKAMASHYLLQVKKLKLREASDSSEVIWMVNENSIKNPAQIPLTPKPVFFETLSVKFPPGLKSRNMTTDCIIKIVATKIATVY